MATMQQKANAEKYAGAIRNLTISAKALRSNILQVTNFWNGLTAAQQTNLNALLTDLGYDAPELGTVRDKLATVATDIGLITENTDPSF